MESASPSRPAILAIPTAPEGAADKTTPEGAADKTTPEGAADKTTPEGAADKTTPPGAGDRELLVEQVRALMSRAVPRDQGDDRFQPPWPPAGLLAAVETSVPASESPSAASDRSEPAAPTTARAYLGGVLPDDRNRPWAIDGLLADPASDGRSRAIALWRALAAAFPAAQADNHPSTPASHPPAEIELWGRPAQDWHAQLAEELGLRPGRTLLQLRAPLPRAAAADDGRPTLQTRSFNPDRDLDALREVNNRAFDWHPDQGGQTNADLLKTMAQPWFRAEGLRVADDPDHPGRLLGFCWTKVHEPATAEHGGLGEIFVIGVDPDHHGKGLGAPTTAAGLDWLTAQGIRTAMLYVEAENAPAVAVYRRLGFATNRTDRSWFGSWPSSS